MRMNRRTFSLGMGGAVGAAALGPAASWAQRSDRMNILCWEGYNSDRVLDPFRAMHPGARVRAESGTSDPNMINRLRAGETNVWDLINLNQPWARDQLYPEGLIRPLDQDRFMPYFDKMKPDFNAPYPLAFADDGALLGLPQRYGPFSFVVNTDVISRSMAEDQGWDLFLDPEMEGRYGLLTYDNWNIIHLCLTAGLDPFSPIDAAGMERFEEVARQIIGGARLLTDDLVAMNIALINGEIDAYFTGGTYTASPARYDGASFVRAVTPNSGPVDGKGGVVWVELVMAVNNPDPSTLADDFLDYIMQPEVAKTVAFPDGTYNPVTNMGDPEVMALFDAEELDAIQFDTLDAEMERSLEYRVVANYDELMEIYTRVRRS